MADEFEQFILDAIKLQMNGIEIGFTAKILSFNKVTMTANIKPMLRSKTEEDGADKPKFIDTPDIDGVPVSLILAGKSYIRPVYVKGDLVKIACTASSIQQPIESDLRSDTLKDRFQLNYCVVTGAIVTKTFVPPLSWALKSGLLIGNDTTLINIKDSGFEIEGDVEVDGNFDIDGDIKATGNIEAEGDIKAEGEVSAKSGLSGQVSLSTHQHPTAALGLPSPPIPGT